MMGGSVDFIHQEVNAAYEALTGTTNPVGKKCQHFFGICMFQEG